MMHRPVAAACAAFVIFSSACGGSGDGDQASPDSGAPTVEARFPVDGVVDFAGVGAVHEAELDVYNEKAVKQAWTASLKWGAANDDRHLYLAFEWTDDDVNREFDDITREFTDFDGFHLYIDNDGDGNYASGEDKRFLVVVPGGCFCVDSHNTGNPLETAFDVVGDGCAYMKYDAARAVYQAEFLIPLAPDANGQDAALTPASRFNISIYDHQKSADGTGFFTQLVFDDLTDSSHWPKIPVEPGPAPDRPGIPGGLTGRIAIMSVHENAARGELYLFDPATGDIVKIAAQGAAKAEYDSLFKNGISLSRDRARIAFMGAPGDPEKDSSYSNSMEIYVINADGTGFARLTNNSLIDGHPAWSPDGTKLLYANYHPSNGGAHIMVMNADGSSPTDLTLISDPLANSYWCDENDPEWLPDGRIVFKTNRYYEFAAWNSDYNQLQIAVMSLDWSNWGTSPPVLVDVHRVSCATGVGDHDPMATGTHALFERITGNYNYLTAPGCFVPWNIVEARIDGSSERILVDDVWVNWLPVYDPTGGYIAYVRSSGYSEIRLMTRGGADLGRFVPGVTQVRYFDWK